MSAPNQSKSEVDAMLDKLESHSEEVQKVNDEALIMLANFNRCANRILDLDPQSFPAPGTNLYYLGSTMVDVQAQACSWVESFRADLQDHLRDVRKRDKALLALQIYIDEKWPSQNDQVQPCEDDLMAVKKKVDKAGDDLFDLKWSHTHLAELTLGRLKRYYKDLPIRPGPGAETYGDAGVVWNRAMSQYL